MSEERPLQQAREAPPLPPSRDLQKMRFDEQAVYLAELALASGNRYGGRPDLLLQKCPWRDYRHPERAIAYWKARSKNRKSDQGRIALTEITA